MAAYIDETLSTSTSTAATDAISKGVLSLSGTWAGTVFLEVDADQAGTPAFVALSSEYTSNDVYNWELNAPCKIKATFARTSGDVRIILKGTL